MDRMVLPMQWERNHAAEGHEEQDVNENNSGAIPDPSHCGTTDTVEQAACALREEMEQNGILTQQWLIMRALLTEDAMGRYTEACRQIGIPENPHIPHGTDPNP